MSTSVITTKGMEILSQAPATGSFPYWIGYYGLAYVPPENRGDEGDDKLDAGMKTLTKTGDRIYNIWQGSMTPEGCRQGNAGELYLNGLYTSSILSKFRYVMDKEGNNNLVMFRSTSDSSVSDMEGACVYRGCGAPESLGDPGIADGMPVPAPLFYMGNPVSYAAPPSAQQFVNKYMGDNDYPQKEVQGVKLPAVSTDTRVYGGSSSRMSDTPDGSEPFNYQRDGNRFDWASAKSTYTEGGDMGTALEPDFNRYCETFWKYQSISNYNRFHAPARSEGYLANYEPSCRNMAKCTRLFPISNYRVVSDCAGANGRKLVTDMQYTIKMSISDMFDDTTLRTLTQSGESGITGLDGEDLYQTRKCSVKFNRIGLYAVPMTVHYFRTEESVVDSKKDCTDYALQFQVHGDEEPVLFAVIDLDSTVILRDGGGEPGTYETKVNLKLSNGTTDDSGSLIRDSAIFYNLYEDSSITWYENQLVAAASQAEAVTSLELDVGNLKQLVNNLSANGGCQAQYDDSGDYALKNHTHPYIRNLVDGTASGSVRGINSTPDGTPVTYCRYPSYTATPPTGETLVNTASVSDSSNVLTYYVVTGF